MNITKELIEHFFQDKCNAEEVEKIVAYLNEHPTIVEKYMGEQEWNEYKSSTRLHSVVSQKMLSVVRQSTYGYTQKRIWFKYVAAAAVLIAVVFGVKKFVANTNDFKETNQLTKVFGDTSLPALKWLKNNTKTAKQISLLDGTIVVLEANSELGYYDPFEIDKRRLFLKGEALFKVAKDKFKPFTVFSNEISTTALGTVFKVSDYEKLNVITIKLYEGKVLIKQVDNKIKKWDNDYYLLPGDVFSYNRKTMAADITTSNKKIPVTPNRKISAEGKTITSNWFMFNNQNLAQVFDQLSAIYNVKIMYSSAEINKMNFIGKIDRTDSIENILKDIALLNNLTVIKEHSAYLIRKK
jgi:transmembrane sensor